MIRFLKFMAALIFIAGFFFIIYPYTSDFILSEKHSLDIDEISPETIEKNIESYKDKNYSHSEIENIHKKSDINNKKYVNKNLIIGKIVVPSINLNIVLFDSLDNNSLMNGACTMKKKQVMGEGNYTVGGHFCNNKKILFGSLVDIKKGALVYLTDKKEIFVYKIFKTDVVDDSRIDLLSDDAFDSPVITLMTCYYNEPGKRFMAFGKLYDIFPY